MGFSINTSGTLGDSFIILCKIFDKDVTEVNHFTKHKEVITTISEILSLKNGLTFNVLNEMPANKIPGHLRDGETYNPFPELKLPDVTKFDLPSEYIVIQLQSGVSIEKTPWKKLNNQDLNKIIKNKKIVLIGTDNNFHNLTDVIDLRNKTSILEAFSIISNCKGLYAPVGLLSLFAPSRRVMSNVFIKHNSDEHAMNHMSGKIKEWENYIHYVR